MKRLGKTLLLMTLVLAIAAPIMAAELKKKSRRPKAKGEVRVQVLNEWNQKLAAVGLTAEQKQKVQELFKTHTPKLLAAQKKRVGILSDSERKARMQARKKAEAEGKKGKELTAAVDAAVKLTTEQQTALAAAQKESQVLNGALRKELAALPDSRATQGFEVGQRRQKGKQTGRKRSKASAGQP